MIRNLWIVLIAGVVGLVLVFICSPSTRAQQAQGIPQSQATTATQPQAADGQASFQSPEAAVDALAEAVGDRDRAELRRIFGPRAEELGSGDIEQGDEDMQRLCAALHRGYRFEDVAEGGKKLLIGPDSWVFPVPLVPRNGRWEFDTAEGIEEVMDRRVGKNELDAIATCDYMVAAEKLYYQMDPDKDKVHSYAARLASTPGKRDGLYWTAKDDEPPSPLGPLVASAVERGEIKEPVGGSGQRQPYRGYFFRILKRQGQAAPGGAMDYVDADGRMTKGFALLAWPAEYGRSGVMTFMIGKNGVAYQTDLGEDTPKDADSITEFNPDSKWSRVEEPTTAPSATTQGASP